MHWNFGATVSDSNPRINLSCFSPHQIVLDTFATLSKTQAALYEGVVQENLERMATTEPAGRRGWAPQPCYPCCSFFSSIVLEKQRDSGFYKEKRF